MGGEPKFLQRAVQEAENGASRLTRERADLLSRVSFHKVEIDGFAFSRSKRTEEIIEIRLGPCTNRFRMNQGRRRRIQRIERDHLGASAAVDKKISDCRE